MTLENLPASSRETDTALPQHSLLGDFGSGLSTHLKAPINGFRQLVTGKILDEHTANIAPELESRARIAGEIVGDALVFLAATAIVKRLPAVSAIAPVAAGGLIGLISPLKKGEGVESRITHGVMGAGTMAMLDRGPQLLTSIGLLSSAEKSVAASFTSGALIGAATEQVNVLSSTGHFASFGDTVTGAAAFGLSSSAARWVGNTMGQKAQAFGERSRTADAGSILPTLKEFFRDGASGNSSSDGWHLVLGSGGSKAALTGAGVVLATRAAKIKIDTVGGVSGGLVPAALASADLPSHKLLDVARHTDIAGLLTHRPLFRQVMRHGKKLDLLKDGIYDTTPLGEMVHSHMPGGQWPDNLWTMAVGGERNEVVFTSKGVTEYGPEGQHVLSNNPPHVGDAVRATSAIPGVLASMELYGRRLYDGALGQFGKCPSDMAKKHFGIAEDRIIASLPVGAMTTTNQKLYRFAKYLSGNLDKGSENFVEHAGIVIRPEVNSFHSLRFSLLPAQREEAIMAGYRSALEEFARNNLIKGNALDQARQAGASIDALEQFFAPKPSFNWLRNDLLLLTGPKTA